MEKHQSVPVIIASCLGKVNTTSKWSWNREDNDWRTWPSVKSMRNEMRKRESLSRAKLVGVLSLTCRRGPSSRTWYGPYTWWKPRHLERSRERRSRVGVCWPCLCDSTLDTVNSRVRKNRETAYVDRACDGRASLPIARKPIGAYTRVIDVGEKSSEFLPSERVPTAITCTRSSDRLYLWARARACTCR